MDVAGAGWTKGRLAVATATERKIYRLSAICGCLAALALVIPRFVPNQEGGFASAATAVLVFLGILFGAAVVSLYLLFLTLRVYRDISLLPRLAGLGPGVVLVTALALLFGFLRY
jgi:hypothetical protein